LAELGVNVIWFDAFDAMPPPSSTCPVADGLVDRRPPVWNS